MGPCRWFAPAHSLWGFHGNTYSRTLVLDVVHGSSFSALSCLWEIQRHVLLLLLSSQNISYNLILKGKITSESFANAVKTNDPKSSFGCTIRNGVPHGLPVCGMLNFTSGCAAAGHFSALGWLPWLSFSVEGPRNVLFFGGVHHPFF